jgi:hypothetical protein
MSFTFLEDDEVEDDDDEDEEPDGAFRFSV